MTSNALFFGGIGTLLETSELQREAFNQAFAEAGLDWVWQRDDYRRMLTTAGGARRIEAYARATNTAGVDAAALHARKTALFHDKLARGGLEARPGVERLIAECTKAGIAVGVASTTDRETLEQILSAVGIDTEQLAIITHRGDVNASKPSGEVYTLCLRTLGLRPEQAIAVEDSESGLQAALSAGLRCIATPGTNTLDQDYQGAEQVLSSLDDAAAITAAGLFSARAA